MGGLSEQQLREFADRGFIILPGVVPAELIVAAMQDVNSTARRAIDDIPVSQ